ncbi:MAG: hypothetical protein ACO1SV_03220 [Fimbriimonas sp.]
MASEYKPAPPGWKRVFCRYRTYKRTGKTYDAHDYGHQCWSFLVRE